ESRLLLDHRVSPGCRAGSSSPPGAKPCRISCCDESTLAGRTTDGRTVLSLGLFEDLDDAPTLGRRERPGLHDQDPVTDAALVLLVVSLELVVAAHDLAVEGVLDTVLDGDHDGLVHLVADDQALTDLAGVALV